jgi:carbonic anhydrase/acetyltransferase-like protein (isoleucine patch superfamily)
MTNVYTNPQTHFLPVKYIPNVNKNAYIHQNSAVIGNVALGENVHVAPFASVRGDEGSPIYVGKNSNVQDGVIIHGLETNHGNQVEVNGEKFSVYIGENTSLAHQAQVHGPAKVGNNTFIGMQSFVFKAEVGNNCVVEPTAKVIGVKIADGRYVPAGEIIKTQEQADKLPIITPEYKNKNLNSDVVNVNNALVEGYRRDAYSYPPNYYMAAPGVV